VHIADTLVFERKYQSIILSALGKRVPDRFSKMAV
jgi:hypothetical protein